MKCLQRRKGLSMLSMCIGLSITVLSYTSVCTAEQEILVCAQKSLSVVHAKSNINVVNAEQKSVNPEKGYTQKGQLLTSKEINSFEIKENGNCDLLQLRASGRRGRRPAAPAVAPVVVQRGGGGGEAVLVGLGLFFLFLILIAAASEPSGS